MLLASTIIHSLAAPFYMFCIFNACLGYTCIFAQPSGDGVGVGRIVFSILLLLVLDLSGAVFSGMLYNNVPAAVSFPQLEELISPQCRPKPRINDKKK